MECGQGPQDHSELFGHPFEQQEPVKITIGAEDLDGIMTAGGRGGFGWDPKELEQALSEGLGHGGVVRVGGVVGGGGVGWSRRNSRVVS